MILLYANPIEVKWVKYEPKFEIGYMAENADNIFNYIFTKLNYLDKLTDINLDLLCYFVSLNY